jgi:Arc/MetJ-type ribon-helix-helix transcriptional regulator
MERITVRIPEKQYEKIEQLLEDGEFPNKSEVFRSGLRNELSMYEFDETVSRKTRTAK